MKLSYYMQQRLVKRVIDVIMVVLLIITIFPIFWMLFSSFKSNTEILLGKVPFGRAGNDAIVLEARGRSLFVFTSDGALNKFDIDSGALLKRDSVKSMATSFITDDQNVWIGTADRGFIQASIDDFSKRRVFPYEFKNFDINKVVTTVMAQDNKNIWFGVQQKGIEKLLQFDKEKRSFDKEIDFSCDLSPCQATSILKYGNLLWIGTNKGILAFDPSKNSVVRTYSLGQLGLPQIDIKNLTPYNGNLFFTTSSGIYSFSPSSGKILRSFTAQNGLLSDRVNAVYFSGGNMYAGTNGGLSVVDLMTGSVKNFEAVFTPVEGTKDKRLVRADVFGLCSQADSFFAGASSGRISKINISNSSADKTYLVKDGHMVVRWRNYIDLWKNIDFGLYLKNSLIICGITMVLAMIFATLAAYALARFNFPGNQLFSVGVLATQMIPSIMYLIPIYIMFTKLTQLTGFPMKGTYFGLIMIYSAFFIPFSIWILRGFFAAIPVELEEAARIDGCNPFQVFWYVVLPLAVPGIIATGVYVFLTAWDELMFAWVLCNADTMTIPVGIRLFVGNYQNRFDLMMAAATVATLPVMILFFMLQKHIVKGLTAGAVKG